MKKLISVLVICLVATFTSFASFAEGNLVQNPSFEQSDGALPASWGTSAWDVKPGVSEFMYDIGKGHTGDRFVTVINSSKNDARFTQNVSVKDNTTYKLSCWIKTENVGSDQNAKGANISVEGKLETSRDFKGTNDKWEYAEMYVKTGSGIDYMKVTLGIGGYGAINTGKASFDDVSVEETGSIPEGAIVAQLSKSEQNGAGSSAGASSPGGPGKTVWYLVIAALIVAAGAAVYYFKFIVVNRDKDSEALSEDEGLPGDEPSGNGPSANEPLRNGPAENGFSEITPQDNVMSGNIPSGNGLAGNGLSSNGLPGIKSEGNGLYGNCPSSDGSSWIETSGKESPGDDSTGKEAGEEKNNVSEVRPDNLIGEDNLHPGKSKPGEDDLL